MPELRFRIVIRGTVDAVWKEITRTDAPIAAFDARMDAASLAPGTKLAMRTRDGRHTIIVGEILDCVPHRRFAHTFRYTFFDDPPGKAAYDLEPVEGGVQFTLTIEGVEPGTKTARAVPRLGSLIATTLKAVIETGRPGLLARALSAASRLSQAFLPARCRSENWPVR
jgi:uncharacterized protein YndB with AHSA1/START domain